LPLLLDVIGAISFSRPFGFIEAGDDGGIFKRMQNSLSSISWLMYVDWFYSLHQRLMPVIGNWLAANDRNGHFFNFARQEITARKDRAGDTKDMASQLFAVQHTKPELDDTNIAFMMASNVLAGSDTTSTSARAVIYLLLKSPRCLQRLFNEIEERKSDGRLSYPVKFQEAESWPYLQAVMYEAMRLYPAVGRNLDRDVPAGGLQIGDHWVPEGVSLSFHCSCTSKVMILFQTMVGSTAWAIHRIPEIWGPDVEDFRPERWLDEEKVGDLSESDLYDPIQHR
jgi:cytochrome P450